MITTRFAPSPTGLLHVGHVAAAMFAHARARSVVGGRFLLRLEDIDPVRCRSDYADSIREDLTWLGLGWDGAARRQSEHFAEYGAALDRLREEGLLYPCFCTRAVLVREVTAAGHAPHGPGGLLYPGTCRHLAAAERADRLAAGEAHAWRLDMAAAIRRVGPLSFHEQGQGRLGCDPAAFGDAVLARKDVPASYHLCVTHDDAVQGVTLVTRGEDLLASTSLHRLLQTLLGWPEPGYAHHPLLRDADGRRLSKREGAPSVRDMRAAGLQPSDVLLKARGTR